jgi:hypothetical protein
MGRYASRSRGWIAWILLLAVVACERSPTGGGDHSLEEVRISDLRSGAQPVATWTPAQGWSGALPELSLSMTQPLSLGVRIFAHGGVERPLQAGGEYSAEWVLAPGATAGIVSTSDTPGPRFHGNEVRIFGLAPGSTAIQFVLVHGNHADGATTPIPLRVVE